ncbi:MAG: cadmium-translocating P-type ATPase [Gammaproteobacteria bacterium]|nr:cadmium-translocating P-type ATPase [Gammaproteobacteria bacterium]MBT8104989.1 cadmium-translocating P-type ATPase [Gammaproteobacteria bacterium]NNF49230.1 cadmium-translocating P-type ATPase [Woeseiaceae bacterium]NNK25003.1 cadmium-translocating P-type ATPase [Woeseiaceae bacterium]NNL62408.1 cadmium-translocating P-type ATPase [Woeseiaceae bacterium]
MNSETCFHCALPIPSGCNLTVDIEGERRPVCCPGCKAVAELIRDTGLSRYYELRDLPDPGVGRPPEEAAEWSVFDGDDMLAAFTEASGDNREATIYVGGMYCSACSWLIETTMSKQPGIESAEINPITHRLRLTFPAEGASLSAYLARLADLGYQPQPLSPESTARPEVVEQRTALKRLLVASLGMMQVMMFAVGLYAMDYQGIDPDMQHFLRLVSFFVTTPVVFYSAKPFFTSAWRGVVGKKPGMDLPVSIAVGAAYAASVYATFTRGEAVWFDSVTMFVFFLTLGRFLEMRARHRSIDRSAALSSLLPNTATRLDETAHSVVPVSQLRKDDRVLIRAGEPIPADGLLASGSTSVDEALLTGEPRPQAKAVGDELSAGSVNLDGMIEMTVTQTGSDTTLGTISILSERARYARPAFVTLADRIASYIVVALLVVATGVATFWYFADPDRAFVITLSVLVVTCPCALALATPAAFAAAGSRMSQLRLLVTNGNAIEALSRATLAMFDKTGTLTNGMPRITSVLVVDNNFTEMDCRLVAAALEHASTHPLARAFAMQDELPSVTSHEVVVGQGIKGIIDGNEWRIGSAAFVGGAAGPSEEIATHVLLGVDGSVVAWFALEDELRHDAGETLREVRRLGLRTALVSGDNQLAVDEVAAKLEITDAHAECTPEDKLAIIKAAQERGERVVMIGDGINDAPVLAGADTSIAPAHGALLAQTSADVIMLGESLEPMTTAIAMSRKTMRIVRQNLAWAIVYNAVALPLAAAGYVPPWAAAIGMSASSLIVVLNALRLNRFE